MIAITKYCNWSDVSYLLKIYGEEVRLLHHTDFTCQDSRTIYDILDGCQALVIMGGEDIHPNFYDQERHLATGPCNTMRDGFEYALLHTATDMGIKIFGMCRGHQMINVAFGGDLNQDIYTQGFPDHTNTHYVELSNFGTKMFNGRRNILVNSLHHQAVGNIAPDFEIHGFSPDGIIEMIYSEKYNALGVQWHPEWINTTEEVWKWLIN